MPTSKTHPALILAATILIGSAALLVTGGASAQQAALPASNEEAAARLEASPRHTEWVEIESRGDKINAYIVFPERSDNAPVVVVIHEIYGLTNWVRSVADQLAAEGFIAIAPDMLSGKGPNGAGSNSVDRQGAVNLMRSLDNSEVVRRLNMTVDYATALPAATQRFGVVGFCWGGGTSFMYAAMRPDLGAAAVYYGSSPNEQSLRRIQAPVMGFYGGDDRRVNATIDPAKDVLDRLSKRYEPNIYEGAGHGFLRAQTDRSGANMRASEQAWRDTVTFFKAELEAS